MKRLLFVPLLTLLLVAGIVACGGDSDSPPQSNVALTLAEWEITAEPSTFRAGDVIFELQNSGEVAHNLVIAKSDLPPGELSTTDHAVDVSKINIAGSAGPVAPGTTMEGDTAYEVALTPGKYVLFCDVVVRDGEEVVSHYENGMHTLLLVEP